MLKTLKDAAKWMGEDYEHGDDKSHWTALMLCCWFFDKVSGAAQLCRSPIVATRTHPPSTVLPRRLQHQFYMPVATACAFHITVVFGMANPSLFVISCTIAIILLVLLVLWVPFLWRLLDPADARRADGEVSYAPPLEGATSEVSRETAPSQGDGAASNGATTASREGGAQDRGATERSLWLERSVAEDDGRGGSREETFADHEDNGGANGTPLGGDLDNALPLLSTASSESKSACRAALTQCWHAIRSCCRRNAHVIRREPLFQRYKVLRHAAYSTWSTGAKNSTAARTMACEFFLQRLVFGAVIGVSAKWAKGQAVLAWIACIFFVATSVVMGSSACTIACVANKVPFVQVPAEAVADVFESSKARLSHLLGRISVALAYTVALYNVVGEACADPDSRSCELAGQLALVVSGFSFLLPIVFALPVALQLLRDKLCNRGKSGLAEEEQEGGAGDGYAEHIDNAGGEQEPAAAATPDATTSGRVVAPKTVLVAAV